MGGEGSVLDPMLVKMRRWMEKGRTNEEHILSASERLDETSPVRRQSETDLASIHRQAPPIMGTGWLYRNK